MKSFRLKLLAELKNSLFKNTAKNSMSFKLPSPPSVISEREAQSQATSPEIIMSQCPSPTKTEHDEPFDEVDRGSNYKQRRTFTVASTTKKKPSFADGRLRFPSFFNPPSFS